MLTAVRPTEGVVDNVPGSENRELYGYQSLRGAVPTLLKVFLLFFVVVFLSS